MFVFLHRYYSCLHFKVILGELCSSSGAHRLVCCKHFRKALTDVFGDQSRCERVKCALPFCTFWNVSAYSLQHSSAQTKNITLVRAVIGHPVVMVLITLWNVSDVFFYGTVYLKVQSFFCLLFLLTVCSTLVVVYCLNNVLFFFNHSNSYFLMECAKCPEIPQQSKLQLVLGFSLNLVWELVFWMFIQRAFTTQVRLNEKVNGSCPTLRLAPGSPIMFDGTYSKLVWFNKLYWFAACATKNLYNLSATVLHIWSHLHDAPTF